MTVSADIEKLTFQIRQTANRPLPTRIMKFSLASEYTANQLLRCIRVPVVLVVQNFPKYSLKKKKGSSSDAFDFVVIMLSHNTLNAFS